MKEQLVTAKLGLLRTTLLYLQMDRDGIFCLVLSSKTYNIWIFIKRRDFFNLLIAIIFIIALPKIRLSMPVWRGESRRFLPAS